MVDHQDYTVWKQYFGTTNPVADGNADGTVNLADYVVWRNNLGASLPDPVVSDIQSTTTESVENQEDLSAAKSLVWPVFDTEGDDSDRPQAATEGSVTGSGEQDVPFALESDASNREACSRDRDLLRPGLLDIAYSEWLEGMSGAPGLFLDFEGLDLD